MTIPAQIFEAGAQFGGHVAIRDEDGSETLYRDLEPQAVAVAGGLIAAGIRPGDRVAIWAPNRSEWIISALGLQAAGAVLVPLNTRLKGREAAHILERSGARLLFTVGAFLGTDYPALIADQDLPALERIVRLDSEEWTRLAQEGVPHLDEARARLASLGPDDLSDILFTSGTTGLPKGAMTAHGQNLELFRSYATTLGYGPDDSYLIVNPFFHSFGYKAGWLTGLISGATILPHSTFDAPSVLRRIEAERITLLPGPPTLYQSLLAADWRAHDLSSLRVAVTGAASVPEALIREMRESLGFDIVLTAYGLTEACGVVTMCSPGDPVSVIARTAGRPIPGVEVRIAPGTGELLVRGAGVMRGYFNDPAATANAIDADGWLHTGDVAVADESGNIRITDRLGDVFIVGGFNAYPAEIEGLLAAHPAIAQSAVVGVPDARLGQVGKAWVVLRPGASLDAAELTDWCRANMANYKVPRSFAFVDALPQNASGKVQKFVLREGA